MYKAMMEIGPQKQRYVGFSASMQSAWFTQPAWDRQSILIHEHIKVTNFGDDGLEFKHF